MITVNSSAVVEGKIETFTIQSAQTIGNVLSKYGFYPGHPHTNLIVCTVNGLMVAPDLWPERIIRPTDEVEFYVTPNGAEIIIGALVGALIGIAAAMLYKPTVTGNYTNQRQGNKIEGSNAQANTAKLGQVVPDIAGEPVTYPDVIVPSRTYFVQDESGEEPKSIQWYEVGLMVGRGYYDKEDADVLVGNTPIISLGDYASFQYHEPGEDVSGDSAFDWWHTCDEVGSTRTGDSGLELTTTSVVTESASPNVINVEDNVLTIPAGQGSFPDDWVSGLLVRLDRENYTITFENDTTNNRAVIRGIALDRFNPSTGLEIEIQRSDNDGRYIVDTFVPTDGSTQATMTLNFPNGAPVTSWGTTGQFKITLGVPGQVYTIVSVTSDTMVVAQPRPETAAVWDGFPTQTWNNYTIVLDPSTREADWIGPFAACPRGATATAVELDFHFPQGLISYNDKGDERDATVTVEVQWRPVASADSWESVTYTYNARTPDAKGYTESIEFASARNAEFRVRLVKADDHGNKTSRMQANWYQLKARMVGNATSYEGYTTLGVRIQGDKRTSSFTDNKINCRVTRRLNRLLSNGTFTENLQGTRSPVDYAIYMLKDIGYEDKFLNLQELADLRVTMTQRGDTYDWKQDEQSTVKELVTQALNVGFADITFRDGKLTGVKDRSRAGEVPDVGLTSSSMFEEMKIDFTTPNYDDNDGITVTYRDYVTWAEKTVKCYLPGDQGLRAKNITAKGFTNRDKAYQFGMRQRQELSLRRMTYTAVTGLDGRNMSWMSYLGLANDVPKFTQSGQLTNIIQLTGGRVQVYTSQKFDFSETGDKLICFRRPDGSLTESSVATLVTQSNSGTIVECAEPDFEPILLGDGSRFPTELLFGHEQRFMYRALVDDITVDGTYGDEEEPRMTITAFNYDEQLYFYDDKPAPEDA